MKAVLLLNTLEGEARKTMLIQPAQHQETLEKILKLLEDVYG